MADSPERLIAIEETFLTERVLDAIVQLSDDVAASDRDVWKTQLINTAPPLRNILLETGDARLGLMDKAGIDVSMLSLLCPGVQCFPAAQANELARFANDELASIIAQHPTRYMGFACVAPQDPQAAVQELKRCVESLGFAGLLINSHTFGEYLDEPKYQPLLEAVAEMGVPLYLHPRNPPKELMPVLDAAGPSFDESVAWVKHDGGGPRIADAMWGFHMEISLHVTRLLMSGVFERIPKLKLVLGHMGEGLPGMLYRLDWAAKTGFGLPRDVSEYVKRNIWITTSGITHTPLSKAHFRYCHEVIGPDRILYATDFPFGSMAETREALLDTGFEQDDIEAIAWKNAVDLFGLDTAAPWNQR